MWYAYNDLPRWTNHALALVCWATSILVEAMVVIPQATPHLSPGSNVMLALTAVVPAAFGVTYWRRRNDMIACWVDVTIVMLLFLTVVAMLLMRNF